MEHISETVGRLMVQFKNSSDVGRRLSLLLESKVHLLRAREEISELMEMANKAVADIDLLIHEVEVGIN